MRAVNLLPAEYSERRWWAAEPGGHETTKHVLALAGAATALVAIVLGVLYVHQRGIVNDRKETLAGLQVRVTAAEAAVAKAQAEQAAAQAHLAAVQSIASQRMMWEKSLRELAQVMPSNAQLTSLSIQAPAGAVAASPGAGTTASGFSVTGSTTSQRAVALVLDRLELLPWLSTITLQSSARSDTPTGSAVQFSLIAGVTSTGGR